MIVLIACCQIDIERHGLDAFSLQLLKQMGLMPAGGGEGPNVHLTFSYVFFSAHDQKMFWQTIALLLAVQFVLGN